MPGWKICPADARTIENINFSCIGVCPAGFFIIIKGEYIQMYMTYYELSSFPVLLKSHKIARKSKRHKYGTIDYENNLCTKITSLEQELKNGTYKVGKYRTFFVTEPKKREIQALGYKDRIVQHSLCDNFLIPYYEPRLIYANCACRKGKGTYFARQLLKRYYVEFYKKFGTKGYVLKCDIHKYFASIDHDILKNLLSKIPDKQVYNLLCTIIDSYHFDTNVGLPIGNQVSQILGIVFLDKIDRIIKEKCQIKHYVRYMDDLILLSNSKKKLVECLFEIENGLKQINLVLNEKTNISAITTNVEFLGAVYKMTKTGRVILRVRKQTRKRINARIKAIKNLSGEEITVLKKAIIGGLKGHLKGFNANRFFITKRVFLKGPSPLSVINALHIPH